LFQINIIEYCTAENNKAIIPFQWLIFSLSVISLLSDSWAADDTGVRERDQSVWHSWGVCGREVSTLYSFPIIHCCTPSSKI